jgi:hypothetical protein
MGKIRIPEDVFPGFHALSKLEDIQFNEFIDFLNSMQVGSKFTQLQAKLEKYLDPYESREIVKTLLSFEDLIYKGDENYDDLASNLILSLIERDKTLEHVQETEKLKFRLRTIFENSKNFRLTLKAGSLSTEEIAIFRESKIIADIRLVFNDEITDKTRYAVINHKLHITYFTNSEKKDFFVALDYTDLKKLKEDIERAIRKEDVIREDYGESINLINFNN